ncbi:MAG TPA: glycerophosphodiester phosphodiesterase family protein [Anaerolineae bacterium]|nr:glycerophosphodiester phosphodiesterase family protein [Anaerolineae bacterium]
MLQTNLKKIINAYKLFQQGFPQFFIADLLFKIIAFVLLTPITSWLLQTIVNRSDNTAVSNTDIINFLLSPTGTLGLLTILTLTLGILFANQSVLQIIAFGQLKKRPIHYFTALKHTATHASNLLKLGTTFILTILLTLLPVALTVALLYRRNLSQYDINYYLDLTPPEFQQVVLITLFLLVILLAVWLYLGIAWLFALPNILFSPQRRSQALPHSYQLARNNRWSIAQLLGLWLLINTLIPLLTTIISQQISTRLLATATDRLPLLILIMGGTLITFFIISYLISLATSAITAILIVHLHQELTTEPEPFPLHDVYITKDVWRPTQRLLWLILPLALLLSGALGITLAQNLSQPRLVTITAHRGSSAVAPPNTIAALHQAIADGADYVEVDVQETSDGVLILNHDSDYMLRAGIPQAVADTPYAVVQQIEVGSRFDEAFRGEGVPTLAQLLDEAHGHVKVAIELKYYGRDEDLAGRVVNLIREKGMEDDVIIMSLNYAATQEIKQLAPDITVGFLASAITIGELTTLNVDFLAVSAAIATPSLLDSAHNNNMPLFVWTLNEKEDISPFISMGVDSIITDYPNRVREIKEERAAMNDAERLLLDFSYLLTR